MKECGKFARFHIYSRRARAFVSVATAARERQIIRIGRAANRARCDVFHLEWFGRIIGGRLAILTAIVSALADFARQSNRNIFAGHQRLEIRVCEGEPTKSFQSD